MGKLKFLKTDADFAAFRASKTYASKFLKIRVHLAPNQNSPRFGFIISKKVVPRVVDRNLLKRRFKSILQSNSARFRNVDVLIFPRKELLQEKFVDLKTEVEKLFTQSNLWKR